MRHALPRIAVLAALIALIAPHARAADTPKAVGTWDVVSTTPQGEMSSVLVVKVEKGQPQVDFELMGEKRTTSEVTLSGDVLKFKVEYEGGVYEIEAKIDASDALAGTWQGNGYSGELKGKRRPA